MRYLCLQVDRLLRGESMQRADLVPERPRIALAQFLAILCTFGLLYGAVMGAFGGLGGERWLQVLYSALKVPLLLLATFLISLPSFFILNTLLGVRNDFAQVLRALGATQAGLTVLLAALAPFTAFWYVSCPNYQAAILFNAFIFGLASISAQHMLRRFYRRLIARHPVHRWLLRLWLVLYAFVGIQMGWVLRPFIGDPTAATSFLRTGAWSNAYVALFRIAWGVLHGG